MNDTPDNSLRDLNWRRPLTTGELARLREHVAAHPESAADWDLEVALTRALDQLPDAPAPSNFTALVLQEIERDSAQPSRARPAWWRFLGWAVRTATAAIVIATAGLSYHGYQVHARSRMAKDVVEFANVVNASPDFIDNFDSIRRLSETQPKADVELISLMQQ